LSRPLTQIVALYRYTGELIRSFIKRHDECEIVAGAAKADNARAWLKKLWRWAYQEEIIDAPVMDRLKLDLPKKTRDRVWSSDEIKAIWKAAEALTPQEAAYVKLIVLLAPRKGAAAGMT